MNRKSFVSFKTFQRYNASFLFVWNLSMRKNPDSLPLIYMLYCIYIYTYIKVILFSSTNVCSRAVRLCPCTRKYDCFVVLNDLYSSSSPFESVISVDMHRVTYKTKCKKKTNKKRVFKLYQKSCKEVGFKTNLLTRIQSKPAFRSFTERTTTTTMTFIRIFYP